MSRFKSFLPNRIFQEGRMASLASLASINTASHKNCEEEEKHRTGWECQALGCFQEASVIMQTI